MSSSRRNIKVVEELPANPFVRNSTQEQEAKQAMADKKREYAQFLHKQIQEKNSKSTPPPIDPLNPSS